MAFNNAHHFRINNLTTLTANNVNISTQSQSITRHPEDILNDARAVEATHTSPIASHASKCNPKTRIEVIGDIVKWVTTARDGEPPKSVLWFPGPAGAGKTCIMRVVVDRCEEEQEREKKGFLVVSYFFSTRSSGLSDERPFMATIAHQLSIDPILKPLILEAIRQRPTIFQESLDLQMNKLVIGPLRLYTSRRILVAVDGLDECSNKPQRKHLLELLQTLAHALPTISILIASRPEQDIRSMFDDQKFTDIAHILRLENYDAMDDTRIFVCDEFEKIRKTHPMKRSLRQDWPTEDGVGILLDRSSGIFIVCSTAMKYIANPRRDPVKSLEEVLALWSRDSPSSKPRNGKSLEELDLLYNLILHPPDSEEAGLALEKRLLHCLIGLFQVGERTTPSFLADLLGLSLGAIDIALCDLHSVLAIPENNCDNIQFHHKSLQDHLLSPDRSLDMFQEPYETHLDLTLCFFHHFQAWARNPSAGSLGEHSLLALPLERWGSHLKLYLLYKPASVPFPDAFLDFDARLVWRIWFAHGISTNLSTFVADYQKLIHLYVCAGGPCSQLCNTMMWMDRCSDNAANTFHSIGNQMDSTIKGLGRFDIESGLYDPNAQFIIETAESKAATFPGFGAYYTFPSSPAAPSTEVALPTIITARPRSTLLSSGPHPSSDISGLAKSSPLTQTTQPDDSREPIAVPARGQWHSVLARVRRGFRKRWD